MEEDKTARDCDESADPAADTADERAFDSVLSVRSLTAVLFPATPPTPVNPRVVKRFSAENESKPRGLASASRLFRSKPFDPGPN